MKLLKLPVILLKGLVWLLVIVVPTLGVWVASSLAAYFNGPIWLACLAGLLLFPAVPLLWDIWGTNRFYAKEEKRKEAGKEPRQRIVTFGDRMILRTFFLNIGFLAVLLASFPQAGFTALATRGDWMLEEVEPQTAEQIRPTLFSAAEGLSWLYELSMDNPYEQYQDDEPLPTPTADEFGKAETKTGGDKPDPKPDPKPDAKPDDPDPKPDDPDKPDQPDKTEVVDHNLEDPNKPKPEPTRETGKAPAWPMKEELHPVVKKIPPAVETDYASVATYIKEREPDPFLRIKAMNDYIAQRIEYDFPALRSGDFPPQTAKASFDRKTAVCAGYARLLEAMGKVTGDEIVYVVGVIRRQDGSIPGSGHAWNAAKIEGKWYLLDPTWNDGDQEDGSGSYSTNYLFTPPDVMGLDHFPDDEAWQLRTDPLTRGEFMRQPMLPPEFYAKGLELVSPQRSQFEASGGRAQIRLKNPQKQKVIASVFRVDGGRENRCKVTGRTDVRVTCDVPSGTYRIKLFAGPSSLTSFPFVAQFEVTSR